MHINAIEVPEHWLRTFGETPGRLLEHQQRVLIEDPTFDAVLVGWLGETVDAGKRAAFGTVIRWREKNGEITETVSHHHVYLLDLPDREWSSQPEHEFWDVEIVR